MTDPGTPPTLSAEAFYDSLADDYDGMTAWQERLVKERPFVEGLVRRWNIRTAMDLGSGTGLHSVLLAQSGVHTTAVDISDAMLARVREHGKRQGLSIETRKLDITMLGSEHLGPYDAILCLGNTIAHVHSADNLRAVLTGSARSLNTGGVLVLHAVQYGQLMDGKEKVLNVRTVGGVTITRSVRAEGAFLRFTIQRMSLEGRAEAQTTVLRAWSASEISELVRAAGGRLAELLGGIDGMPFRPDVSRDLFAIIQFGTT